MRFLDSFKLEIVSYKKYKTMEDIVWGGQVVVPAGFEFDVTVPKALLFLLSGLMFSRVIRAVAVHDYEYTMQENSRSSADKQLREMMIADGVPKFCAYLAYAGTRLLGWQYWDAATKWEIHDIKPES